MKRIHRLLSLILTICIVMPALIGFAPANVAAKIKTVDNAAFDLPDIVDSAEAIENGYIGRVEAQEKDLNTFVFANGDGTNTMKVYSHPVKYIASDGSVRDISLDVEAKTGGGFVTADHEIVTTFDSKLAEGISLKYNDVEIKLVPELSSGIEPTAILSSDSKAVTYEMNDITSFVYKLTYAGFKEDIVVEKYTGQTEYEFTLYTNGLTLCEEYGSYYLADSDGNIKANIGDIIVFTADERNNTMGSMTYETVRANQEYVLTIHLDADYLADEATVYPIHIDPTIEINYDNDGAGSIEDVTINENVTFGGTSGSLYIGRHPAGSLSRVLMRFPKLSLSGIYGTQISSASVEIRDLMCQGSENFTIECRTYNNSAPSWSESGTTTWSSVGSSYLGDVLDSHLISYGRGNVSGDSQRYSFDILDAARAWADGTQSPSKGLVFKADSAFENQAGTNIKKWYKTFAAYNRSDYRPSLSITYGSAISIDYSRTSIVEGGTKTLVATTNPSGQTVTWSTSDSTVATVSSSGVVTAKKAGSVTITATSVDSEGNTNRATCIVYVTVPNGVYYIQNKNSDYYLTTNGRISNFTDVYQYSQYSSSYIETTRIRQMWKINYLGNGRYSVRPMHKLDMGLDVTGENVDIYNIGTSDTLSTTPSYGVWTIKWYSTGYIFQNNGDSSLTMQVKNASVSSGETVVASAYSASVNCRWGLTKISSPPSGVYFYDTSTNSVISGTTKYVAPEESRTLSDMSLAAVAYDGTNIYQTLTWTTSNSSVATVDSSGTVTGKAQGTVTITAKKHLNGSYRSTSFTLKATEVANGTYFLENKRTGKYVDIEYQSMNNGTKIHQWEFHGGSTQRWIFTHLGDGYYSIKSANSSSGYYLGVSEDSTENDKPVLLRTGSLTNGMKWKISKTSSGAYKITPKTGEANDRVLAVGFYPINNDGIEIQQRDYVNDNNYKDEWIISRVSYSIHLEPQHQTNWCWAASAKMSSQSRMISSISQESAAVYVKLGIKTTAPTATQISNANYPADVGETERSLEYILSSNNIYSKWGNVYSESVLRTILSNNNPVIILRGWYDAVGNRTGGHFVVIYGYHWDSTNGIYLYDIMDPEPVNIGSTYSRSYQSICNGRNPAFPLDKTDTGRWEGIVVFENGNYNNTISWTST